MAEIHNISDLDKYSKEFDKAIDRALIASAYKIRDKAQTHLKSVYPKTAGDIEDGIYVGRVHDKRITISAYNNNGGGESWMARFFVGGAPKNGGYRKQAGGYRKTRDGVIYVKYKKPMSKGRINPTNSLSIALEQQRPTIKAFFNHLKIDE